MTWSVNGLNNKTKRNKVEKILLKRTQILFVFEKNFGKKEIRK